MTQQSLMKSATSKNPDSTAFQNAAMAQSNPIQEVLRLIKDEPHQLLCQTPTWTGSEKSSAAVLINFATQRHEVDADKIQAEKIPGAIKTAMESLSSADRLSASVFINHLLGNRPYNVRGGFGAAQVAALEIWATIAPYAPGPLADHIKRHAFVLYCNDKNQSAMQVLRGLGLREQDIIEVAEAIGQRTHPGPRPC